MSAAPGDHRQFASTAWFEVQVQGPAVKGGIWAVVQTVSGLQESFKTIDYYEGGQHDQPHRLPGGKQFQNVILQGVVTDGKDIYDWFSKVRPGRIKDARCQVTVTLMHQTSNGPSSIGEWLVSDAYPIRYTGPSLDRSKEAVAFEQIELVHTGIKRAS